MITALVLIVLVGVAVVAALIARPPVSSPAPRGRDTSADGLGEMLDPGIFAALMPDEQVR